MIDEDELKNAFIVKLACIGESYNKKEIKWNSGSQMTRTIDFPDGSISNAVVRFYRKDKSIHSYCEYKDSKKHGTRKEWFSNGTLKSESKFDDGKKVWAKIYFVTGELKEDKMYVKGSLHGYVKKYARHTAKDAKKYNSLTYLHKVYQYNNGYARGLSSTFRSTGIKERDAIHQGSGTWHGYSGIHGSLAYDDTIEYDKHGNPCKMFVQTDSYYYGDLKYMNRKSIRKYKYATHYAYKTEKGFRILEIKKKAS